LNRHSALRRLFSETRGSSCHTYVMILGRDAGTVLGGALLFSRGLGLSRLLRRLLGHRLFDSIG